MAQKAEKCLLDPLLSPPLGCPEVSRACLLPLRLDVIRICQGPEATEPRSHDLNSGQNNPSSLAPPWCVLQQLESSHAAGEGSTHKPDVRPRAFHECQLELTRQYM